MYDEFIFDLKVARKKSGLTQADCGHLIGVSHHIISQIERGQRMPTIDEICALSLIYQKGFESLYAAVLTRARASISERLKSMPEAPQGWAAHHARKQTLARLSNRLAEELADNGGS